MAIPKASDLVIRFACVNPAHRSDPGGGFLVVHHGTCGWCPRSGAVGPHRWVDTGGVRLGDLLSRGPHVDVAATAR